MDAQRFYLPPDQTANRAFRGLLRLPQDVEALDRIACELMEAGDFISADRLAWLAAGLREAAP